MAVPGVATAGGDFVFAAPTRIVVDDGGCRRIGGLLAAWQPRRVLIITDRAVQAAGIIDEVRASLGRAGIAVEQHAHARVNPRLEDSDALATQFRDSGIDALLAVGGGSVMDLAKSASLLLGRDANAAASSVQDYLGGRPITGPLLPLACIPTTAGTGSEVTPYAVLSDPRTGHKLCLTDTALIPSLALLDPGVLLTLPSTVLASTALDALTHAIEACTCRRSNPISDALALQAISMIYASLEPAATGVAGAHRRQLLLASTMAGLAFANADVAAVHCLSEALGGRYDWPHGVCNARLLPVVFRHNIESDPQRHALVAHAIGVDAALPPARAAEAAATAIESLVGRLGIPRLGTLPGADPADIPVLAAAAKANISDASNARTMTPADYAALLNATFGY